MADGKCCGGLREVLARCAPWGLAAGLPEGLDAAFDVAVEQPDGVRALRTRSAPARSDIEGPWHVACRVLSRLEDDEGRYCGDGLLELSLPAAGMLMVGAALRVICSDGRFRVRRMGLRLVAGNGWSAVTPRGLAAGGKALGLAEAGELAILRRGGSFLGLYWGRDLPLWCDRLGGGEGPWAPLEGGQRPPFYQGWESHLRQWPAPRGWRARAGSAVAAADNGVMLAWRADGAAPDAAPDEPVLNCSGAAAILCAPSEEEIRRLAATLAAPLAAEVAGAVPVGLDLVEGTSRFRRTAAGCALTLPADPLGRCLTVRLDGPPTAAFACSVDGGPAVPQLVSIGRTDDPNGPDDGRPDGNGRPVLASEEAGAERLELSVRLSPERPTRVEVAEANGLSLSWLGQDDRRELLLWSSRDPEAPLGRLSLHDLRLRDLRLPGADWPAAACLPLYWYMMNAPSPWQSANLLRSIGIRENGPERVRLALSSVNPDGALLSTCEAELRLSESGALLCDVRTRLEVRGRFPAPHLQFLNLFPEATRDPRRWLRDRTHFACGDLARTVDHRENDGGLKRVSLTTPCFMAQYPDGRRAGAEQGLLAVLIEAVRPERAGTGLSYELCRCWLDNHFDILFPEGGPAPGSVFEADFQVVFAPGIRSDREVGDWAARSLASGRLEP